MQKVLLWCKYWLQSQYSEYVINSVIGLYALLLLVESSVGGQALQWLKWVEMKIVFILCFEIAIRLAVRPREELRSWWFYFDVVATGLAFIPGNEAFRALRLVRWLSSYKDAKRALEYLASGIRASRGELAIAAVLIVVNSLVGHKAFAGVLPERFAFVGDAMLSSTLLALFDDPWTVYSVAFETNILAASFHLVVVLLTTLFVFPMIISQILKIYQER